MKFHFLFSSRQELREGHAPGCGHSETDASRGPIEGRVVLPEHRLLRNSREEKEKMDFKWKEIHSLDGFHMTSDRNLQ